MKGQCVRIKTAKTFRNTIDTKSLKMSEDATNNEIELNHDGDNEAADNDDADKSKERKHDCGAADLVIKFYFKSSCFCL